MQNEHVNKSKRIAKNTVILYFRMLLLMAVSLYTSRVILSTLGVDDFGIYNVVGGFVALFAVLSKSLSSACSRFFNYEMGKGRSSKLEKVFSSSVWIHLFLAIIVAVLGGVIGAWFVSEKMVISPDRIYAANWVLVFSIVTFCANLIAVPYHAAIIAHERMKTFAYVSLFEGFAKLGISFLIIVSPIDTLIFYACLLCLLQFSVNVMYFIYCRRSFVECRTFMTLENGVLKEMMSYASWTFVGTSASILRNHGGSILINLFFGPVANAARAIANQVLHAVDGFVSNFVIALKPQITQSYSSGDRSYMMQLVYRGAKFSYFMILFLSLPILLNTEYILNLWLKKTPQIATIFVQLTLLHSMIESLSHPLITAQQATGKIRNYQLVVGGLQLLNLPIAYIVYKMGAPVESFFFVAIGCSIACLIARLIMLRTHVKLDALDFTRKVILRVVVVSIFSALIPILLKSMMQLSMLTFVIMSLSSFIWTFLVIYFIGCDKGEQEIVVKYIKKLRDKIKN